MKKVLLLFCLVNLGYAAKEAEKPKYNLWCLTSHSKVIDFAKVSISPNGEVIAVNNANNQSIILDNTGKTICRAPFDKELKLERTFISNNIYVDVSSKNNPAINKSTHIVRAYDHYFNLIYQQVMPSPCCSTKLINNRLAFGYKDGRIVLIDILNRDISVFNCDNYLRECFSVAMSIDSKKLIVGEIIKILKEKSESKEEIGTEIEEPEEQVIGIKRQVRLFEISQKEVLGKKKQALEPQALFDSQGYVLLSNNNEAIAKGDDSKGILFIIFSLVPKKQKIIPIGPKTAVYTFTANPTWNYLVVAYYDKKVKVFDLKTKKEIYTYISAHQIVSVDISDDGNYIVLGDDQGYVTILRGIVVAKAKSKYF